jgi:hypothetical protein
MSNPLIDVYTTLADIIGGGPVAQLVKEGNFQRYDIEPGQADAWQTGDMPRLELLWVPGAPRNVNQTSSAARIDLQFSLLYYTDTDQLNGPNRLGLMYVDWAVMQSLFRSGTKLNNNPYVVRWDVTAFSPVEPDDQADMENMARGWAAEMLILVETRIDHTLF